MQALRASLKMHDIILGIIEMNGKHALWQERGFLFEQASLWEYSDKYHMWVWFNLLLCAWK